MSSSDETTKPSRKRGQPPSFQVISEVIKEGNLIQLTEWLEEGSLPFLPTQHDNQNYFTEAAKLGSLQSVTLLYTHRQTINLGFNHYGPALVAACLAGHFHVVDYLQNNIRGIFVPIDELFDTFIKVCGLGHLQIVRRLIHDDDLDINESNHRGKTPLAAACQGGHLDVVKYLIKHRAKVNYDSMIAADSIEEDGNALSAAVYGNHLHIVKYLVEQRKACVTMCSPLASLYTDNIELLTYLHKKGARLNETRYGANCLFNSCYIGMYVCTYVGA